jgi:hypothetical protein
MTLAEEQVEQVQPIAVPDERTGTQVTRYVFEGETFASESDAEAVRQDRIRNIARGYYVDLPAALTENRKGKLS